MNTPKERTPIAGNILSISRSKEEQAKEVAAKATSYMPTSVNLDTLMPAEPNETSPVDQPPIAEPPAKPASAKQQRKPVQAGKRRGRGEAPGTETPEAAATRKRVSLYLDDDVLFKIFKVSMEHREQLSSATHRLINEALEARGL